MNKLELIKMDYCPFCQKVMRALKNLNLSVEVSLIDLTPELREEIRLNTGKTSVPALRLLNQSIMVESNDIIEYIKSNFSK